MKQKIITIALAITLGIAVGGCSKEDSTPPQTPSVVYYIPNLLTDHQDYRSLNVFQNKYFYLTGASQSDSTIMYFRQNQQYSNSQPSYSCYATRPLSYSRSLTGGSWEFIHTVIPKVELKDFSTNSSDIVGTQTRRITSCNIVTEQ